MPAVLTTVTTTSGPPAEVWEPFRVLLQVQRDDCLQQRELALAETVSAQPDLVAVSRAASLLNRIEEIDAALARIAAGTYGKCAHCGADIPRERLEFRPHALCCVGCPEPTR